ncbi:uncharacterized [Tachysurus ichikawai]
MKLKKLKYLHCKAGSVGYREGQDGERKSERRKVHGRECMSEKQENEGAREGKRGSRREEEGKAWPSQRQQLGAQQCDSQSLTCSLRRRRIGDVIQKKVGDTEEGRQAKRKSVSVTSTGDLNVCKQTLQTLSDAGCD